MSAAPSTPPAPLDSNWIFSDSFKAFGLFLVFSVLIYLHLRYSYTFYQNDRRSRITNHFRSADAGDEENPNSGLDSAAIAALPAFKYEATKRDGGGAADAAGGDDIECPICFGEMEEGEMLRLLPACKHLFHVVCVDEWLLTNSTCPICRAVVMPPPPPLELVVSTEAG